MALDVAGECHRHQPVAFAPDEQRRRLQRGQPFPAAAGSVGLVDVDLAQRREEGDPAPRLAEDAQELVRGGRVPLVGKPRGPGEERLDGAHNAVVGQHQGHDR